MMQGLESEIKIAPACSLPLHATHATHDGAPRRPCNNEKILLNTPQWRQEAPFQQHDSRTPLTGCVGTAMAMISEIP